MPKRGIGIGIQGLAHGLKKAYAAGLSSSSNDFVLDNYGLEQTAGTWKSPAGAPHPNGGGWVESTAKVAPTAYVGSGCYVRDYAQILDHAVVAEGSTVNGSAVICEEAKILSSTAISGYADIGGYASIQSSNIDKHVTIRGNVVIRRSVMTSESYLEAQLSAEDREKDLVFLDGDLVIANINDVRILREISALVRRGVPSDRIMGWLDSL